MEKSNEPKVDTQILKEVRKPKKSLKQRCAVMGAIPLKHFEDEFWKAFEDGYRKYRNKFS